MIVSDLIPSVPADVSFASVLTLESLLPQAAMENTIAKAKDAVTEIVNIEKGFEPISMPVIENVEPSRVILEPIPTTEFQSVTEEVPALSKNEQILLFYKEGKDEVEIAKALDCGLGEVRLVLGLYNNET